ncbi:hypothetical protein K1T71_004656 [Dendrolimus kikuchii]|uniref:Uncharacterized protein n=1 Tax=Dendrolimus kikuchii TaxID=765133 RepID=A0ACC1D8B0_9NEOP|nr:hypothetical protein K1T71_004656 [Dendrolimus kikuchii]
MSRDDNLTRRLLVLMQETGYPLVQRNGQRRFGPPLDWTGPPPPKGCEVFIGKLPRDIYEDVLVPIFTKIGRIYEMRLMMDFSGSNRGYAFVTYATRVEANKAIKEVDGFEIQPGKRIGVVKSVDNCRLFIGGIPKEKTKREVLDELSKNVSGIVDVILYKNCFDTKLNRGFAFVEFTSHSAAAMARRALVPGEVKLWGHDVMVDWAEPEPYVDDEQMQRVKVLYVRNFLIKTTPETIKLAFETAINTKVEHVKKMYDYAFIHFYDRAHAELAMKLMQNSNIDGSIIEIRWAKPVDRDLYRIQKMTRGNAKFNNSNLNFSQTMLLYKHHLEKKEYLNCPNDEDATGSVCSGLNPGQQTPTKTWIMPPASQNQYTLARAKLESMCKRYMWASPVYSCQKHLDPIGREVYVGKVELPLVGLPLLTLPRQIGPLITLPCSSMEEAHEKAAECALYFIKTLRVEAIQRSTMTPMQPVQTLFPQIMPSMPTCVGLPCEYMTTSMYTSPQALPLPAQRMWHSV